MSTATIDGSVLDILADDIIVECVAKTLTEERKIAAAYIAGRDAGSNDARRATASVVWFARNEQDEIRRRLHDRVQRLVEDIVRQESK